MLPTADPGTIVANSLVEGRSWVKSVPPLVDFQSPPGPYIPIMYTTPAVTGSTAMLHIDEVSSLAPFAPVLTCVHVEPQSVDLYSPPLPGVFPRGEVPSQTVWPSNGSSTKLCVSVAPGGEMLSHLPAAGSAVQGRGGTFPASTEPIGPASVPEDPLAPPAELPPLPPVDPPALEPPAALAPADPLEWAPPMLELPPLAPELGVPLEQFGFEQRFAPAVLRPFVDGFVPEILGA